MLDDTELNAHLTHLGLEGTGLEIRRPGQEPRPLSSERLTELLELVDSIERKAKILARRGIPLAHFIGQRDSSGRLPVVRAQSNGDEEYFYAEDDFQAYRRDKVALGASVVRHELTEAPLLRQYLDQLADFGCDVSDLFLRREEQVTGELSPAIFVLTTTSGDPAELNNLLELPAGVRSIGARGREIKRFKGLGEMNKQELWETTMNPANRVMRQVVIGETDADPEQIAIDAAEADTMFSILMGDDVERRREFIEDNAIRVKNLDI